MIHPLVIVFATIVVMAILFALLYFGSEVYERSEEQRLQLHKNRYEKAIEVKASTHYSIRFQPGVSADTPASTYLSVCNPISQSGQAATMSQPGIVTLEMDAQAFDDMALAWIKYRGLASAVEGPSGNKLGRSDDS